MTSPAAKSQKYQGEYNPVLFFSLHLKRDVNMEASSHQLVTHCVTIVWTHFDLELVL